MKAQLIPLRSAEWFIARIGKEIISVNGQTSAPIKIADKKMANQLYFDAQLTFGIMFTDEPMENSSESGDIVFSEASIPKTDSKQAINNWSEIQAPNLQIPYNHITLDTPLGVFVIDWKGWKENPTYDLSLNDEWLDSPFSLEEGKEFVKKYLTERAEALNDFIEGLEG